MNWHVERLAFLGLAALGAVMVVLVARRRLSDQGARLLGLVGVLAGLASVGVSVATPITVGQNTLGAAVVCGRAVSDGVSWAEDAQQVTRGRGQICLQAQADLTLRWLALTCAVLVVLALVGVLVRRLRFAALARRDSRARPAR